MYMYCKCSCNDDGRRRVTNEGQFKSFARQVVKLQQRGFICDDTADSTLATICKILTFGHFYNSEYTKIMNVINV